LSTIVFSLFSAGAASAATMPAAPTLIAPMEQSVVTTSLPVITGLVHADLRVAVYIDDVFNGYATMVSEANGVQSFAYEPFLGLGIGEHSVMVRAEDTNAGTRSDKSDVRMFHVVHALPAPTVIGAVVNDDSSASQPFMVGVAPADSTVTVMIDGQEVGTTTATSHVSGIGDFAFRAPSNLRAGWHNVTAIASEPSGFGRTSRVSQKTAILISAPAVTAEASTSNSNNDEPSGSAGQADQETQETIAPEESSSNNEVGDVTTDDTLSSDVSAGDAVAEVSEVETDSKDEEDESTEAGTDDQDNKLTFLGWIALLIVAITVVARARKRRSGDMSEVTFSPSSDTKGSVDGSGKPQGQLDLQAPIENKNITVIKHDSDSTDHKENGQS